MSSRKLVTKDANNSIFVLAFGIGDSKNSNTSYESSRKHMASVMRCILYRIDTPNIRYAIHDVRPNIVHDFLLTISYRISENHMSMPGRIS